MHWKAESQNHLGWKESEDYLFYPPCSQARSPTALYPGLCPVRFSVLPEMETTSQKKKVSLCLHWIYHFLICAHCFLFSGHHWKKFSSALFILSCQIVIHNNRMLLETEHLQKSSHDKCSSNFIIFVTLRWIGSVESLCPAWTLEATLDTVFQTWSHQYWSTGCITSVERAGNSISNTP